MKAKMSLAVLALMSTMTIAQAADSTAKTAAPAASSSAPADNTQILMDKIKADKKLVVADNMNLTEAEAKNFWPLYNSFQGDLAKLNDRLVNLITSYGKDYNANTMTDEKAKKLIDESLAINQAEVTMFKSWSTKLNGVLPQIKAARYLQIESKIRNLVKAEIAQGVPLVP